jgi:hybrid cluster-associated redox disulfide protein
MMEPSLPNPDMTVADVLDRWPETVAVFRQFKTACVGCVMAPFDTLSDMAQIYGLEPGEVILAMRQAVEAVQGNGRGGSIVASEVETR